MSELLKERSSMPIAGAVCRSCSSARLEPIICLGRMALANSYLEKGALAKPEPLYPLDLAFCPDCSLVQILETVPPEILFREYLYFSSFSETVLENARNIANQLMRERKLNKDSLVVELASNDGYLLQNFVNGGIGVLGIEPAVNVAKIAREKGIRTMDEFFGVELSERLVSEGCRADVIIGNNVLAHVADLNGFVRGIRHLLKNDGVVVMEVPYVKDMIDHTEFDTIYHEHLCYYSLASLTHLFERHGLALSDAERIPIHGGSLRIYAMHAEGCRASRRLVALRKEEEEWGTASLDFYLRFAAKVGRLKESLLGILGDLKKKGETIAGYGAAAKGSVLLNYCGIGPELLDYVVDRNHYKQGKYMPGVHIPIHSPDIIESAKPDYLLLLAWNFAQEIIRQQEKFRREGGRFIVPVPEPRVIGE